MRWVAFAIPFKYERTLSVLGRRRKVGGGGGNQTWELGKEGLRGLSHPLL